MKTLYHLSIYIAFLFFWMACNSNSSQLDGVDEQSETGLAQSEKGKDKEISMIKVSDENEKSFTVDIPKGWDYKVSLERPHGQMRNCGVAVSPDGKSRIFFGDPSLPTFQTPMPEYGMYEGMQMGPLTQISNYVAADQFLANYAKMAFGRNKDFKVTKVEQNNQLKKTTEDAYKKAGLPVQITAATVSFEFQENGEQRLGQINGTCAGGSGMWTVDLNGFSSDSEKFSQTQMLLEKMVSSYKVDPNWRAKEDQAFAARMQAQQQQSQQYMQQMTNAHNQRMSDMNANFNAHQQRMGNMSAANDAQYQSWQNNQASSDNQHRKTIDMIRGKEQVRSGNQYGKVQAGYNYYYVNPNSGQYYGTNSETQNVPDGYEQWRVDD